jgi:hypothetical protein
LKAANQQLAESIKENARLSANCKERIKEGGKEAAEEIIVLHRQLAEVRSQLEKEGASREGIETELSEKKQNSAPAATLSEKLTPDAATILSQLRAKRKKSTATLGDVEKILEILEG